MTFWEQDALAENIVDPRLETAIGDAERLPPGKARDVKLAALYTEKSDQETHGYQGPVYGDKQPNVKQDSFWMKDAVTEPEDEEFWKQDAEPEKGFWEDDAMAPGPSIATRLMQGPIDTIGNLAETTMAIGALPLDFAKRGALAVGAKDLASTIETGQDWMLKQGTEAGEIARNALMTPEERETGTTTEKVLQNVAGILPALPLGLAAAPVLGATGGYMAGKAFVDAGEGVLPSMGAAALQTGANAAGIALPGFGRTIGHTAALIVGGGPVLGGLGDLATQQLTDNEKLKKSFDPLDPVNRITDTVTSGVFGGVAHYKGKTERLMMQLDHYARTDPDKFQKTIETFAGDFSQLLRYNNVPSFRMPGENWDDAYIRLEKEWMTGAEGQQALLDKFSDLNASEALRNPINAAQALEVLVHSAETPRQEAQAKYLLNIAEDLGLNLTELMVIRDFPRHLGASAVGMYDSRIDTALIDKGRTEKYSILDRKGIMLHEIQHAVTTRLLNFIDDAKTQNTLDASAMTPYQKALHASGAVAQLDKLNSFLEFLRNKLGVSEDANGKWTNFDWYSLKNAKELFSELFNDRSDSGKSPVDLLRSVELSPEEMKRFNHQMDLEVTNQFHELATALRGPGQGSIPHTALDVAINHFFGMMEHNNLETRTVASALKATPRDSATAVATSYKTEMKNIIKALRADPYKRHLYRGLIEAVHNAPTFDNFLTKAGLVNGSPEWKAFLRQHGEAIFARSNVLRKALIAAGGYKDLPDNVRAFTSDDRMPWEFYRDEFGKIRDADGVLTDDLGISAIATIFHNPSTLRHLGKPGFADRLKKYMLDKGDEWAAKGNELYNRHMNPVQQTWKALRGKKERAQLFDAMEHWNRLAGQDELAKLGLTYATPDMMRAKFNLNDRQLAAYKALTDMFNSLYDLNNQTHRIGPSWNGKDLERTPGYMPNFHDGVYKVFVNAEVSPGVWKTKLVRGFNNAWTAKHFGAEMVKRGFEVQKFGRGSSQTPYKISRYDEIANPFMVTIRENLHQYFNQDVLDQIGIQKIQQAEDEIMSGMPKHLMERQDVSGFLGEMGAKPVWDASTPGGRDIKAMVKWHVFGHSEAFKIFERYAQGTTEAWKNAMFLNDVWRPLMSADAGYMNARLNHGEFLKDFPKLHNYLSKYSLNFIGQDVNHFRAFDNMFGDFFQKVGLDPYIYRTASKSIRNMLAAIKLRVNPANWINNAIQPVHAIAWLEYMNSRTGFKQSPLLALNKLMAHDFKPDDGLLAALQRARESHILDPQLQLEIAETERRGPFKAIASDIEETGRTMAFMVSYLHARDLHKGNEVLAFDTAKQVMQQVMVNYDQHSRPLMYQNFGVLGTLAAPFAVFRNAYIGNTWLMLKNIKENPLEAHRYMPLLASQLIYLGAAGSLGMVGVGEYNTIADAVNEMMSEDVLPRAEDVFYENGMPDWFIYGPMSTHGTKMLGMEDGSYIGPSGSAIGIDDVASLPVKPFFQAIAGLGKLAMKSGYALVDENAAPPSLTDLYPLTRQFMPPVAQGLHDKLYQSGDSDVVFTTSGLEGSYRRNEKDQLAIAMMGKQSIPETAARIKERSIKRRDAFVTKQVNGLVQAAADRAEGKPGLRTSDQLFEAAARLNVAQDEFADKVVKEIEDRRLSKVEKDAAGAGTTSGARKWMIREGLGR